LIINMIVDLRTAPLATPGEEELLAAAGLTLAHANGTSEEEHRWIERTFDGQWPKEAAAGWNWFAKDHAGSTAGFATYEQRKYHWWWLRGWLDRRDVGLFGPMGVDQRLRGKGIGRVLARRALASLRDLGFAQALIPAVGPVEFYERACGARVVERLRRTLFGIRREAV
jgi:GNAT superfamily N-acetyltransferase